MARRSSVSRSLCSCVSTHARPAPSSACSSSGALWLRVLIFRPMPSTITTGNSRPLLLCVVMMRTTSSLSPMALALMLSPPARSRAA